MSHNDGIKPISTSLQEIFSLLELAERDLKQADIVELHLDTRYALAYNAALQLATATLRLHGIRVRSTAYHLRTFEELRGYLPREIEPLATYFDRARRKRHIVMYDKAGAVSLDEVIELIAQVRKYRAWLVGVLENRFAGERFDILASPDNPT